MLDLTMCLIENINYYRYNIFELMHVDVHRDIQLYVSI